MSSEHVFPLKWSRRVQWRDLVLCQQVPSGSPETESLWSFTILYREITMFHETLSLWANLKGNEGFWIRPLHSFVYSALQQFTIIFDGSASVLCLLGFHSNPLFFSTPPWPFLVRKWHVNKSFLTQAQKSMFSFWPSQTNVILCVCGLSATHFC